MASAKICGLSKAEHVAAAVDAGAAYIGFMFYPPSPRNVDTATARTLAAEVPAGVAKVGLFVDPDDALLDTVLAEVPLDFLQLHKVADPARIADIRERAGLPVILGMPVAVADDIERALDAASSADMILFDAKPAAGAVLPGGNGISFDWHLLANRRISRPWMLAGGLTPENVARAIALTGARAVDVSSGVEDAPGRKSAERIAAFVHAATTA